MYRGRIVDILPAGATKEHLGLLMAGVKPEDIPDSAKKKSAGPVEKVF
jgi:hypothetical protein